MYETLSESSMQSLVILSPNSPLLLVTVPFPLLIIPIESVIVPEISLTSHSGVAGIIV